MVDVMIPITMHLPVKFEVKTLSCGHVFHADCMEQWGQAPDLDHLGPSLWENWELVTCLVVSQAMTGTNDVGYQPTNYREI